MCMCSHIKNAKDASRPLFILGVLLILLGILGIIAPKFISLAISIIIALMLIFAGVILFFYQRLLSETNKMSWTKVLAPLIMGLFLLIKPFALVIVLGLAIFIYFLLDAVATITLALEWKGLPGWKFFFIKGVISLILAGAFIVFWPYSTYWYVGFMVGISLILDGLYLIGISKALGIE